MKLYKIFLVYLVFFSATSIFSQFLGWSERSSGVTSRLNSVYVEYDNSIICGDSGVVLISTSGLTWSRINGLPSNINLENVGAYFSSNIGTILVAGNIGSTSYVYKTSNSGVNWSVVFIQPNGHINNVWLDYSGKAFIQGNPVGGRWSLWKSTNFGSTFDSANMRLPQSASESGWSNSMYVNSSGNKIWFGTNNNRIYYSSNFGTSWSAQQTDTVSNIYSIWFVGTDQKGYAGGTSTLVTTNGGSNWTAITTPGTGNVLGFSGQLSEWIKAYARGNSIYYTISPTSSFPYTHISPGGSYTHMNMPKSYSGGGQFICIRSDGGISRYGYDFVGINGISNEVPGGYSLMQNYPNPFNPATNIKFSIPVSGNVRLIVYDMLGKEVKTLVNENLKAGTYNADWDAAQFSSGVYFYRIEAGTFSAIRKMILVK
jgi:hypothetical protein